MIFEVILFLVVLLILYHMLMKRPEGLPPGDWGYPIIGYLSPNRKALEGMIVEQRSKYGDIFSVKIGSQIVVFLADYKMIKNAFTKPHIIGRPTTYNYSAISYHTGYGMGVSNGHIWEENRRFAIKTLRNFGVGKSRLEAIIVTEIVELVNYFTKEVNKPVKIDWSINAAILNVIWQIAANKRYNINDEEIRNLFDKLRRILEITDGPLGLLEFFPWLEYVLPEYVKNNIMNIKESEEHYSYYRKFLDVLIAEHKKTFDKNNIRDYIDAYLFDLEEGGASDKKNAFKNDLTNLNASLFVLFVAGTETTASILRWFLIYMCNYPEIQARIQRDIDAVVGKERMPLLSDRDKLRYFEATLYEIGRIVSLVPRIDTHVALEETELNGFRIPKGTWVIACADLCHMSPKYFDQPHEFRPERFLDPEGNLDTKKEGYLPFSLGRRVCIGEALSKTQAFLFGAAVLQKFKVSAPAGTKMVDLTPVTDNMFFNFPPSCEIVFTAR